jgi:anti-sigma factor RsiW
MNCGSMATRLQEYVDGQLAPTEAQSVEDHLAVCSACRADLSLLVQVDETLAQMPVLPEPEDMTAQIMVRVCASTPVQPVAPFRLRWEDAAVSAAFAWAAVAALAVLLLFSVQGATPPQVLMQQAWWTWSARIDRLWHALQLEPVYLAGALSGLCTAAAVAASAVVMARQCLTWRRSSSS